MSNWNSNYTSSMGHFVMTLNGARSPASGSMTLTGAVPTVWANAGNYAPGAGVLALTGLAPTIWNNAGVYTPGAGELTFAGEVPTLAVA